MSTDQAVNSETIEQTKQQIRGLVSEIAQLSKSELRADDYYAAFLQRIISALAAVGGAIWILRDGRRLDLAYHIKLDESLMDAESEDATKHLMLLSQITASGEPALVPPMSAAADERAGANPTPFLLVVAPLKGDNQIEGVVEIFQRPDAQPVTQRGYLKFLVQMCELASEWLKTRKLRQISDRHSLWQQADHFARLVHQDLNTRETAYTIVNEGRRMIGCDRVSVGLMHGRICKIEAVSGQDTIENRSNIVNYLGKLATRVLATGESLWFDGSTEDLPPQVEEALDDYIDESHTKMIAILPMRRPKGTDTTRETVTGEADEESNEANEIIGAMIVEQIEGELPEEVLRSHTDLVYEHSARALTNAVDHNRVFMMPVWQTLGKARWLVTARNLPKTVIALVAILSITLALFLVPADFQPKSSGALQPVVKHDIFVTVDGDVIDVCVEDKQRVAKDEILVKLRNMDLEVEYHDIVGQIQQKKSLYLFKLRELNDDKFREDYERIRLRGETEELEQQLITLNKEYELLKKKREMLEIRSPIAGEIMMSWDVQKTLLRRPVTTGQVLMSVADPDDDWELELYMRESRSGHVRNARADKDLRAKHEGAGERVLYVLKTNAGVELEGQLVKIKDGTELHEEEGSIVKMKVAIDRQDIGNPHPGATVTAKVYCGRKPLGYVWFHEAWEWFQGNILFYLT